MAGLPEQQKRKWEQEQASEGSRKRFPDTNTSRARSIASYIEQMEQISSSASNPRLNSGQLPLYMEQSTPGPYLSGPPPNEHVFAGEHRDVAVDQGTTDLADFSQYSPRPQVGAPYFVSPPQRSQAPNAANAVAGAPMPVFGELSPINAASSGHARYAALPAVYAGSSNKHAMPLPAKLPRTQTMGSKATGEANVQRVRSFPPESSPTGLLPSPYFSSAQEPSGVAEYDCMDPACLFSVSFGSAEELSEHERAHEEARGTKTSQLLLPGSPQNTPPMTAGPETPYSTSQMSPMSMAPSPEDTNEHTLLDLAGRFPTQSALVWKNHVQVRVYYCAVTVPCKQVQDGHEFEDEKELRKHQRCHIAEEDCPCLCGIDGCPRRFLYASYRKRHQDEEHHDVQYYCIVCGKSAKRFNNLYGKGRHFENHHPRVGKPSLAEAKIRPRTTALPTPLQSAAPATPQPSQSVAPSASAPIRRAEPHVTPRPAAASLPPTPSAPPRSQAPTQFLAPIPQTRHAAQEHDVRHIDPELRHFEQQYYSQRPASGQLRAGALPSSTSRRTSAATPPSAQVHAFGSSSSSRRTSATTPESSRSLAPSDGLLSRSSRLSTSTAPTSVSASSGSRRLYSHVAEQATRTSPISPTPTRSAPTHGAKSSAPSRKKSKSPSYGTDPFSIPMRLTGPNREFGGKGSSPRHH